MGRKLMLVVLLASVFLFVRDVRRIENPQVAEHFLMTVRHRVPASYPLFIPFPVMLTGTMGAVIGIGWESERAVAVIVPSASQTGSA